jgi:hypothetical protein
MVATLRFAVTQNNRGNKHVFQGPLSRYEKNGNNNNNNNFY